MSKTYVEKLKDPRWQKMRLKVLEAGDWICADCYRDDKSLHVHHKIYRKGSEPWEYAESDLVVLCEDCHAAREAAKAEVNEHLKLEYNREYVETFFRMLEGTGYGGDLARFANLMRQVLIDIGYDHDLLHRVLPKQAVVEDTQKQAIGRVWQSSDKTRQALSEEISFQIEALRNGVREIINTK